MLRRAAYSSSPRVTANASFHASAKRKVHPILMFLGRAGLVLAGRGARRAYLKLSKDEKRRFWSKYRNRFYFCMGSAGVGSGAYYVSHLEKAPVTGRRRFMIFNHIEEVKLGETVAKVLIEKYNLEDSDADIRELPKTDPAYKRVKRVTDRLIKALGKLGPGVVDPKVLKNLKWDLHVIKAKTPMVNAFVLPNGSIWIYKGLLDQECRGPDGDDRLAVVLGHEMAHALQRHSGEQMSEQNITNALLLALSFGFPALGLDFLGLSWFMQKRFIDTIMILPHSRACEMEADHVGLLLMGAACHEPRAAPHLWETWNDMMRPKNAPKLSKQEKEQEQRWENLSEFLHTHPSHEHRSEALEKLIPEADLLRDKNCTQAELDFLTASREAIRKREDAKRGKNRRGWLRRLSLFSSVLELEK